jgi:PAS domain S-box-containing protein
MRTLIISHVPNYLVQFTIVFAGYFIAGRLGQATTNIRSSNLGPVWPAYGVALGAILLCGYRIWPAVAAAAFVVAFLSPESVLTALGQAAGSTFAAVTGVFLLRLANFDNSISRFRDALALVLLGGLGSATVSASIGTLILHSSKVHAYSGLGSAWLIYWLGDSTGVLLVTPLALTVPSLFRIRGWSRLAELFFLLVILVAVCTLVFNNLNMVPVRMMSFVILPIVIWAAVRFGVSGAAVSMFVVATVATVETAWGSGPFAVSTPFMNAVQLDAFFTVFSLTGLTLATLYSERERAENERAQSLRKQVAMEVRLQDEERLRASEERLRLAQHAARIGTFERDLGTGIVTWSTELELMYGLSPGEFDGTTTAFFEKLIHPEDRDRIKDLQRLGLETAKPINGEWRVIWPDGSVHWIAGHWQVLRNESGETVRVLGVNMDVTERKLTEGRLREYEEAVEGAEDMIAVIDREYRFLLANRQYLKMRNLTREQVVGHLIPEVLSEDIFETFLKPKLDQCFQGKVVRSEMKFSYPTVGDRDLLLSYFPIEGVNGVDRAACILHDITDRKRAEEALLEMNRTLDAQGSLLRSREELLRAFVKSVPAAVAMLDLDMRYLQVSDRWCSDYVPGGAQILGRSHYEIFPDMPERWKEFHRRALEGETLRADEDRWEGKDGTHWARWEVRPWKTPEGVVGGILILAEDITRRKQMEEALSNLSRKLIESQEQERARIGRELHDDINQRLAMLSLELEQLQENPSEIQPRVEELRRQMAEVSNDVQALSHDLHSSKLEYLGVVAGMRSWCREFAERRRMHIDFKSDVSSAVPLEIGLALFRVLQEAMHNVTKHSGARQVEVQLHEDSSELHLIISDSGKGFDPEAAFQGKGLGLSSMRERVRLINGAINIESKRNGGTTIHVRVRLAADTIARRKAV